MGREHFINADFDLSLRRGGVRPCGRARERQAAELPWHFLLLARGGDSILLDREVDRDFARYFKDCGIEHPKVSVAPSIRRHATLRPFGWNLQASELNRRYAEPVDHPLLDVVRRVNGRRFAAEVETAIGDGKEVLGVFTSVESVVDFLAGQPSSGVEWMVKSEHGNSGLGNRRLRSLPLSEADRRVIEGMLVENPCVVLERFRPRVLDLASVFEVSGDGSIHGLQIHEVVNTADGAFIGAIFDLDSRTVEPWREKIGTAVKTAARRLARDGYKGPVCIDSFVWDDDGLPRLRALVDINARGCMSAPGKSLWRDWGRDRVVYWRLFSARKLRLPSSFDDLVVALGDDAFDPLRRCGVLLTSPLGFDAGRPLRYGVLLAGMDRPEVERLDERLRGQFEQ